MPHKRNPILAERIAGLARLLRGYAGAALENQPLWHERDISHSSAERVLLPDATILLDYMLVKMTGLVGGLVVRPERMRENIERGLGLHASSRVLVALVEDAGLSREDAYAIVQAAALRAADERRPLRELLATEPTVAARLSLGPARRLLRRRHVPAPRLGRDRPTRPARGRAGRAGRALGAARPGRGVRAASRACPRAGGRRCRSLSRSCARARSATCTTSTPTRSCSSRRTGCRPSTSSCRRAIPDKGRVLTGLSRFWFAETAGIVPNHLRSTSPADLPPGSIVTESLDPGIRPGDPRRGAGRRPPTWPAGS